MTSQLARRVVWGVAALLFIAVVAVMVARQALLEDFPEGVSLDNRTEQELIFYATVGPADDPDDVLIGTIGPRRHVGFSVGGCGGNGLEARDADGEVVAALPPIDPQGELGCDFTWVITPTGDHVEP